MRTKWIAVIVAVSIAGMAMAEPPAKYHEWATGPVKHLMTKADMQAWQNVKTDEEAEAFIALFWARRDPTPATPRNEFKEEFDKRVALADEHFTTKRTRGAMTDRGKAVILLGSPTTVGSKGAARGAAANPGGLPRRSGEVTLSGPRGSSAMLAWTYSAEKKPAFIKTKDMEILFVDDAGDGQWQFAITPRVSPESILEDARNYLVVSPNMTSLPSYGTTGGTTEAKALRSSAIKQAFEQFRTDTSKTAMGPALVTWGQYVTPDGEVFVPVQLFLPAGSGIDAGRKLTFFGVVENPAGEIVHVYEEPVTLQASLRDAYVDKSLSLDPGTYKTTLGLAENDKVVAMARTDMTITKLDASEPAVSEMILSNNAYALAEAQLITDPFAFGGFKVVPKADAAFSQKDDIWYFFELRNPGVSDSGMPKIKTKIEFTGTSDDNKPIKMSLPWQDIETIPLKGVKDHYGLAMAVPLKDFAPGKYSTKVKVVDSVLNKTYEASRDFTVAK